MNISSIRKDDIAVRPRNSDITGSARQPADARIKQARCSASQHVEIWGNGLVEEREMSIVLVASA
jgi:hypothetical protein